MSTRPKFPGPTQPANFFVRPGQESNFYKWIKNITVKNWNQFISIILHLHFRYNINIVL